MNDDIDEINNQQTDDSRLPEKASKLKSGLRFTRFCLLLIMVLAALILLLVNKDKINSDNFRRLAAKIDLGLPIGSGTDNSVIDYEFDSSGVLGIYKDGIARVTSDNLVITDNAGTQFQSVLTGLTNPAMVTTDKYVLVYDRGGTRLLITNSFTTVFETSFDSNIVSVSMNDSGYYAVLTESDTYKNKLIVFNSSFKEIYQINSMTRYIVNADISSDNKSIAVSTLTVKDGSVIPQISLYRLSSEESLWNYDFEGNAAIAVRIKDSGTVCALFEWGICILDGKGNERSRYEFGNMILQCCYIERSRYNVLVLSESVSGASHIVVFDSSGKQISDIDTGYTVRSIDMSGERIAALSMNSYYVYGLSGNIITQSDNTNDGNRIMFSGKNAVLVVSASEAVYNLINS